MLKVDAEAVALLLADIAAGKTPAETSHDGGCTWTVRASGYVIEIFDDSGEADYVERVTDPKGKSATFNQFMNALGRDPIDHLTEEQKKKLSGRLYGDYIDAQMKKTKTEKALKE